MTFNPIRGFRRALGAALAFALASTAAFAQLPTSVDIDLVPGAAANQLDVRLRANTNTFSEVISSVVFTVRWPDTSPATLGGVGTSAWCPSPSSAWQPSATPMVTTGGFKYRRYSYVAQAQIGWIQDDGGCGATGTSLPANTWVTVYTITVTGNTGCTAYEIAPTTDPYTSANNSNYFISLNGNQTLVGTIEPTPVNLGSCSTDCAGVVGGTASVDGCGVCSGGTTGITPRSPASATISYAGTPFCTNGGTASVTFSGTTGGAYSSTAGLTINSSTGAVTLGTSTPGPYTVTYTVAAYGTCPQFQTTAPIVISGVPTPANAGTDQTVCASGATLAGNTATVGTGAWSIISGAGGSVTTPSSATSGFTGVAGTTYTLRWTISNAPCTASTDDVTITLVATPTTASAGPDQTVCGSGATLAANTASVGTGAWSIISGAGGSVTTPSSATSGFTGVAGTTYTLRWTISNAPCTASTDDVIITLRANPTTANAGTDQTVCASGATLAGNTASVGTGAWSIISGAGGSVTTPSSATSGFTGVAGTTYTLRWTISNAPCTASTDDVTITLVATPTTANAGTDQTVCGSGATLAGNTATVGTGAWSIISGAGGSVTTPSSATSGFTGVAGTTYTLRWTISNAPCTASTDDVTITLVATPTTANAGTDQTVCASGATLAGNTATVGTGAWSIISGAGGSVTTPSSATSGFTGVAGTTYTLRWTISNAPCTASTDDVTITLVATPTTANAGTDQTVCGSGATLAGNTATVGTGAWSIISGAGGSVTTPSSATSGFTGVAGTTYTLRWTISNAPCTASTDDVVITLVAAPTTASAGPDQTVCGIGATLAANTASVGTGAWSIISGAGGSVTTPSSATSGFTGVAGTTYTLRWTISNAPCTASTDDVTITLVATPTTASAGPDQTVCGSGATLAANTASVGTGAWSIISGAGGSVTTPSSATSGFTGVAGTTYTLRWTISNAPCTASTDDVIITLRANPTTANAGTDQTVCASGATLAGNTASVGTGAWSIISGAGGSVTTPSSATSGFTGVAGTTYTLRWTISNAPCTASTDDVTITLVATPTTANAGTDQTVCGSGATLAGNTATVGTGAWSIISGAGGSVTTPSSATSGFTGVAGTTYTLRWTISNAPCTASTDDVVITLTATAPVADAGTDQSICSTPGSTTMAANAAAPGTGTWTLESGGAAIITSPNSPTTTITGMTTNGNRVFRWTITNAPCASTFDEVTVSVSSSAIWYQDADNDGFGDPAVTLSSCTQPPGYVSNSNDLCLNTPNGEGVNSDGCSCSQVVVDDSNPCTLDQCTNGVVTHTLQDADADGVCNANDACPGTAAGAGVNPQGCSCAQVTVDDGIPCTLDECVNGVVTHTNQDADADGVCDANDLCPGSVTSAGIGVNAQGCTCAQVTVDDGNPCTLDECLNGTVTHTFQDQDSDGVCDANDPCPTQANVVPGQSCNDNNACTINDVVTANCGCAGTFQDTDSDGTCDANDVCPLLPFLVPGNTCDDGNGATVGDVVTANCICAGVLPNDCNGVPGGPAQPGTSCNDNNICTINDVFDANCNCAGTFQDSDSDGTCDANDPCPTQANVVPGQSCNDNDPCTTNDVITANCGCAGTFQDTDSDGTCDANDPCPTQANVVPGQSCNDNDPCTINDVITANCGCAGTFQDTDSDGTCDANDVCPLLPFLVPGNTCDDGNGATVGDVVTANCICAGVLPNDCNGVPGGPAQPGTSCNDNNVCTINDVFDANCGCAGTFQDTDSDGTCDANDPCPTQANVVPGQSCNDNDPCTINDVVTANCGCAGTFQDTDSDGTCDANDPCPTQANVVPGQSCNDNNPCTINDVITANCGCAGTFQDTDSDGICNAEDNCPTVIGVVGSPCDDGNVGTDPDFLNADCICQGTPIGGCDQPVTIEIQTDANGDETTWEIIPQGGGAAVCAGGPYIGQDNTTLSESCCLTTGCYELRVIDGGGDGITTGGYVLRTQVGKRIIDNRNNGAGFSNVSQISAGQGFCLPLGMDRLIVVSCDKEYWSTGEYIVANENPAVSALWVVGGANSVQSNTTGYEMWFVNPNGGYSFRRFHSHATSDGFGPANATRACHIKLNNWGASNQLPVGTMLNVRVRGRVNGNNLEWGPACRFRLDPVAAQCPPTQLVNLPTLNEYSCGVERQFPSTQRVYAWTRTGATNYQFEFTYAPEGFIKVRTHTVNYTTMNWNADPLEDGVTYSVRVRISKNNMATWCQWGEPCEVSINNGVVNLAGDHRDLVIDVPKEPTMKVYPNPNRGEQLTVSLDGFSDATGSMTLEMYDLLGSKIFSRNVVLTDGAMNSTMDLPETLRSGVYILQLTGPDVVRTERVIVQR